MVLYVSPFDEEQRPKIGVLKKLAIVFVGLRVSANFLALLDRHTY